MLYYRITKWNRFGIRSVREDHFIMSGILPAGAFCARVESFIVESFRGQGERGNTFIHPGCVPAGA